MNFIAPEFLYALGFLAIPILIHLFNFRRYKTVQFSQVRFLKSIKQQTQSTSRLKHILVLISRCLAIAALVFAFAQPFLSTEEPDATVGTAGVIVYIDNSFSMQASAEVGSLLDVAKNKALAVAKAHKASDKFQLHTNEFMASEQRWLNREAFINSLQEVDFSPKFRTFEAVTNRLNGIENDANYRLKKFLIGDLQKISYTVNDPQDSSQLFIIPTFSQLQENVWIKNFSAYQPFHLPVLNEKFDLNIEKNTGNDRNQINGKLLINGLLKNPFIAEMKGDSVVKELSFSNPESDLILGKVTVKDYPVVFDDTFYFAYPTNKRIKVLHVFNKIKNNSVATLFRNDSLMNFEASAIEQIDYSIVKTSNLIILENVERFSSGLLSELTSFVNLGGTLFILPSADLDKASINSFLNQFTIKGYGAKATDTLKITQLNSKSNLFRNVFEEAPENINYPNSYLSWSILTNSNTITEPILSFGNGSSYLEKYELSSGNIFLSSSNLSTNSSNFGKHALFVPIVYNMALQSSSVRETSYILDEVKIEIKGIKASESPLRMKRGNNEWIPKQNWKENSVEIFLRDQIFEPGFYQLIKDDKVIETLAFNYNRNESDLAYYEVGEFQAQAMEKGLQIVVIDSNLESLSASIGEMDKSQNLWKYFVMLSLFFIGLEILFLQILK